MPSNAKTILAGLVFLLSVSQITRVTGCDPFLTRPAPTTYNSAPIDVTSDPIQADYSQPDPIVLNRDGNAYALTPVAKYTISGRIVSQRRYRPGWDYGLAAELSPVDFAMTWGDLAKPESDQYIRYDHGQRFMHYYYDPGKVPFTQQYMIEHSSNTHLIPATPNIDRVIKTVKKNEIAVLDGYLVNMRSLQKQSVYTWSTSLTRKDTGGGACELMYVTEIRIGNAVYR
jgi:hypothetical protein